MDTATESCMLFNINLQLHIFNNNSQEKKLVKLNFAGVELVQRLNGSLES